MKRGWLLWPLRQRHRSEDERVRTPIGWHTSEAVTRPSRQDNDNCIGSFHRKSKFDFYYWTLTPRIDIFKHNSTLFSSRQVNTTHLSHFFPTAVNIAQKSSYAGTTDFSALEVSWLLGHERMSLRQTNWLIASRDESIQADAGNRSWTYAATTHFRNSATQFRLFPRQASGLVFWTRQCCNVLKGIKVEPEAIQWGMQSRLTYEVV